jgi:hypothetical protein
VTPRTAGLKERHETCIWYDDFHPTSATLYKILADVQGFGGADGGADSVAHHEEATDVPASSSPEQT